MAACGADPSPAIAGNDDQAGVHSTTKVTTDSPKRVAALPALPLPLPGHSTLTIHGLFPTTAAQLIAEDVSPFLGTVTLNGREIANAGLYRTVPIRQLPIGLTKSEVRFHEQSADQIEGGLFSTIEVKTIRPLDLKQRQVDFDAQAIYSPYASRAGQGPGTHFSGSYADQFDTGIGRIGVSIGFSATDSFVPNDFYEGATTVRPCNSVGASGNCTFTRGSAGPTYYAASSATFRQQRSDEKQRGFAGSVQWQPSEKWDVLLDAEHTTDVTARNRSELDLLDGTRAITPIEIAPSGALLRYSGESAFDTTSFQRTRADNYTGGGLRSTYQATSRLSITGDLSYSRMHRSQDDWSASLSSNSLFGPDGRVGYTLDQSAHAIPVVTFSSPIDLTNHDAFTEDPAARHGRERQLDQTGAARFDLTYRMSGLFDRLEFGMRYAEHRRRSSLNSLLSNGEISNANALAGNAACRVGQIVKNWGADAGTNINSWAVFDTRCLYEAFTGSTDPEVALSMHTGGSLEARQRVIDGYAMGDFKTRIGDVPISGDFGVRIVETRTNTIVDHVGSAVATRQSTGNVIDALPNLNLVAHLRDDLPLKFSVYETLLRDDLEGLGVRRIVAAAAPKAGAIIPERQRPVRSWNLDASLDYHIDKRTGVRIGLYYRILSASAWPGDEIIAGGPLLPAALASNTTKGSYIRGLELVLNHRFSDLPAPLDGLGIQASYTFNDTDFHFADPTATDPLNPLANFVQPASVPGLSRHVVVLMGQYERNGTSVRLTYRYRSG
jgi:iron complex outermembrane receptor protein